jgi:hypothetical protein
VLIKQRRLAEAESLLREELEVLTRE